MVALLWTRGQDEATIRLEKLWSEFCDRDGVTLFCAYPRMGARRGDPGEFLARICALHSRVLASA